jgi:Outer membrane protein beta-barrel domain
MKHLIAILLGFAVSAPVMAQLKSPKPPEKLFYMETSINVVKYSEPGLTFGPTALRVTLGKKTSETFGYEGMLGFSVRNAETAYVSSGSTTSTSVAGEVNNLYGLYIKARRNLGSELEIFGKLGMASGERTLSAYPTGLSAADNKFISFSYGLGAKAAVEKDMSVVFDYMSYFHKGLSSVDAFSLGLSLDF